MFLSISIGQFIHGTILNYNLLIPRCKAQSTNLITSYLNRVHPITDAGSNSCLEKIAELNFKKIEEWNKTASIKVFDHKRENADGEIAPVLSSLDYFTNVRIEFINPSHTYSM